MEARHFHGLSVVVSWRVVDSLIVVSSWSVTRLDLVVNVFCFVIFVL